MAVNNDRLLPEPTPAEQANRTRQLEANDRTFADQYVTLPNGQKVSRYLLKLLGYPARSVQRDAS